MIKEWGLGRQKKNVQRGRKNKRGEVVGNCIKREEEYEFCPKRKEKDEEERKTKTTKGLQRTS